MDERDIIAGERMAFQQLYKACLELDKDICSCASEAVGFSDERSKHRKPGVTTDGNGREVVDEESYLFIRHELINIIDSFELFESSLTRMFNWFSHGPRGLARFISTSQSRMFKGMLQGAVPWHHSDTAVMNRMDATYWSIDKTLACPTGWLFAPHRCYLGMLRLDLFVQNISVAWAEIDHQQCASHNKLQFTVQLINLVDSLRRAQHVLWAVIGIAHEQPACGASFPGMHTVQAPFCTLNEHRIIELLTTAHQSIHDSLVERCICEVCAQNKNPVVSVRQHNPYFQWW